MTIWKTKTNVDKKQTILIISQDTEMTAIWETLFQQKNYHVVSETSAYSAIQTARLLCPALIVLEFDLPHAELVMLCKELRGTTQGTLLLLAPKGNEQEIFEYYKAGVDERLTTPISPMALFIKSMAWLVRQEWVVPRAKVSHTYV